MKLQFDSSQAYQLDAIKAITDVFEGQPLNKGDFEVSFSGDGTTLKINEKGVGNNLVLSDEQLLKNLQTIQERNKLPVNSDLDGLNFTVEMETGTGKTYTYLRTIYELNKIYGFKKFVIVVPSVAIKEGTLKNLQITHEHFQLLYNKPPVNYTVYDSKKLSVLRSFASNNAIQILVINIDSFTKDANIINQVREQGIKPIEFIQSTNPIVIVDEPQNMETEIRKKAIENLNPLCTLRYSATHRNLYNLVYKLDPVQAYDLGLVKQIAVNGITAQGNYNAAFIEFSGFDRGKKSLKAKLKIYANERDAVKPKAIKVDLGNDLYQLSGQREIYRNGYIVNSMDAEVGSIEFSNGQIMYAGDSSGGLTDEVMKYQIERTIQEHLSKERKLLSDGIKVLSLIFIDKVANYRDYDEEGNPIKGKFAEWFEEIYEREIKKTENKEVPKFPIEQIHNGYFSQDNKGKSKDTSGTTKADDDTYSLIMKDKEQLLSIEEPLRFIFSHSALREGWDNPNVFQICTLNETKSDIKKRQEIGRGLRLPVNQEGERIFDKNINVLTVVANETYEDFTQQLQKEIEEDTGVQFKGRVKNAREKAHVKLTKQLTKEACPEFFEIWNRIKHRTRYKVAYRTGDLISGAIKEVQAMPNTIRPVIISERAKINITEEGVEGELTHSSRRDTQEVKFQVPDIYGYIQLRVDITRNSIFEILKGSGRYKEVMTNPQMFLDNVIAAIQRTLNRLMIDGIKYERINGAEYQMRLFKDEEIETYLSNLFEVRRQDKTIYNYQQVDSNIESEFAKQCENDEAVKFYFKLPRGFEIPTPIGSYRPDWAVIFENDKRIYFVAETKSTLDAQLLREIEKMKIECGRSHFALFKTEGVQFAHVKDVEGLYQAAQK